MTTKLVSTGVEFPDATTQTTSGVPLTGGTMTGALTTTGFTSTGIDDNATSTAITIDASENVALTSNLTVKASATTGIKAEAAGNITHYNDATPIVIAHRQQWSSAHTATEIVSTLSGASGELSFKTAANWTNSSASERMRISSTGNVGIGTATPDVFTRAYSGTTLGVSSAAGETAFMINSSGTNVAALEIGRAGVRETLIYDTTTQTQIGSLTAKPLVFVANGAEVGRFLSGGGLTFNGDTAAANALDDYEEGTWTPTWSGATASNATYTKIGRVVYASGQFVGTGSGTSGDCGGLPYASAIDGSDGGGSGYHGQDADTWSVLKNNSTNFRFYTGSAQKQISSTNGVRFFLTYHV